MLIFSGQFFHHLFYGFHLNLPYFIVLSYQLLDYSTIIAKSIYRIQGFSQSFLNNKTHTQLLNYVLLSYVQSSSHSLYKN